MSNFISDFVSEKCRGGHISNFGSGRFMTIFKLKWPHPPCQCFIQKSEISRSQLDIFWAKKSKLTKHPNLNNFLRVLEYFFLIFSVVSGGGLAKTLKIRFLYPTLGVRFVGRQTHQA